MIRALAVKHQRDEPQIFYPLRDLAREIDAPVSAVARAYAELKKEGILGTVRASRTVIEGRTFVSPITFKGFIGLPISLSCFITLADYRMFYITLRRELRRRGFVSNMLFFTDDDKGHDQLIHTVQEFGVHLLVWYLPRPSAEEAILSLADRGIRIVGVADGEITAIPCSYEIRRSKGIMDILRKWQAQYGIIAVTMVRTRLGTGADNGAVEATVQKLGIPCAFADINAQPITEMISQLGSQPKHGVILSGNCATILSLRAPYSFDQLLRSYRVAFPDGPLTTLYRHEVHGSADMLWVDWSDIAKVIVDDLTTKSVRKQESATIFDAFARFDVALDRLEPV